MESILKYYEFSPFIKDTSQTFGKNEISYFELNTTHFLIFEKDGDEYNLYISKFKNEKEIGKKPPEIIELLVKSYDKSNSKHRVAIRKYIG
ncbi:MAG: hypothetical protein GKR88_15600 [Flavobacteriaceae bacterium]|nr:MAG: hypothetical protein GKR88_15600 [Flavobacteriaceae bacterium]